jgi:hypothetical protein
MVTVIVDEPPLNVIALSPVCTFAIEPVIDIDVVPAFAMAQPEHDVVIVAEFDVEIRAITLEKPMAPGSETVKSGRAAFEVVFITALDVPEIPG